MFSNICKVLAGFKDYRRGDVDHPLSGLLMVLYLSKIAGCRGWDATADWCKAQFSLLKQYLDLGKFAPSADTFRRTAEAYCLNEFFDSFQATDDCVHFDGKRARGANRDGQVHHFIEAISAGKILGIVETGAGSESPAIIELVHKLDLAGKIITIDAAGTTPDVASAIMEKKADYLISLKQNQPSLFEGTKKAFEENIVHVYKDKNHGHGRHEIRSARVITDQAIIARITSSAAIRGIVSICRIDRTRITKDGIETTTHFHICSRRLTAKEYSRIIRAHWSIESMHHVLDVSLNEDACRICNSAGVVGYIRRLAYAVIAEVRGELSFRRYSEFIRANPKQLLELI